MAGQYLLVVHDTRFEYNPVGEARGQLIDMMVYLNETEDEVAVIFTAPVETFPSEEGIQSVVNRLWQETVGHRKKPWWDHIIFHMPKPDFNQFEETPYLREMIEKGVNLEPDPNQLPEEELWHEDFFKVVFQSFNYPVPGIKLHKNPRYIELEREDLDRFLNLIFPDYHGTDPLLPKWPGTTKSSLLGWLGVWGWKVGKSDNS